MNRIDIAKLRKMVGMSQRELAEQLQVRPSFVSAIENGRSPLPEEKMNRLKEIFEIDSFDDYQIEEEGENPVVVPPHSHEPGDSIAQLLSHFHSLAHMNDHSVHNSESELRIEYLTKRNDRLSQRVDDLIEKVDILRDENLRLKELLIRNGIEY